MQRLNDMSTSELVTTARNYSASITEIGIYSELVKEITDRLAANTAAVNQALKERDEARKQVISMTVENTVLLDKAASELSNAWVLNKYWVGIHAALMHVKAGRLHDGMTWLQNTVSGPGIEVPEFSEVAHIDAWATEQQKDSLSHSQAMELIKNDVMATDDVIAKIQEQFRAEGINYAALRLAAAFNNGFLKKTKAEVADVIRMILSAKEDISNSPAADGLSGEYAEKTLERFVSELSQKDTVNNG